MTPRSSFVAFALIIVLGAGALLSTGCRTVDGKTNDQPAAAPVGISVAAASAVEQPIVRFIHVTGSLIADDAPKSPRKRGRVSSPRPSSAAPPCRPAASSCGSRARRPRRRCARPKPTRRRLRRGSA